MNAARARFGSLLFPDVSTVPGIVPGDAFKLQCCRRLLRVRWTARISNQSFLKEINPEYSVFTGRTDAKAETPILWPPDVKSRLIGKYADAGKD